MNESLRSKQMGKLEVDTSEDNANITTSIVVDRKISRHTQDSDSGHERTSSSSASNCSSEDVAQLQRKAAASLSDDDEDENDDKGNFNQDDCFVDASDELAHEQEAGTRAAAAVAVLKVSKDEQQQRASLKVRLDETTEILRMALSNEFIKALDLCEERAQSELYAGLAHATLSFLRAALTLERADLDLALASIEQSFAVSQQHRRQVSTASMVWRLLYYKPNYNTYTDDEIHAELVNAESMLLLSLISFLADQSVLCLVKGAFRIRACYQRYKECLYILEHRKQWSSDTARRHFESGVRMGHGIFNLLMSYLPRRVLKFLEYVGFSGSRTIGVCELDKSIELADGLRSVFSALVILTYHSYVENLFGLGHYDQQKVEQLNETFLGHYPNSAFFLLFLGRYYQMQGKLSEAIESFEKCCQVQQDWRQFHSICHWEIMWCYACQQEWLQAAHYADLLRAHSKWSPSSYQYQYGTFLYAQLIQEQRSGELSDQSDEFKRRLGEIRAIIDRVPELRIRYAGKTIPADKFAITRAAKFARQSNRLSLPSLEFLYIWNIFCTLRNNPQQVNLLLVNIETEISYINDKLSASSSCELEEDEQIGNTATSSENKTTQQQSGGAGWCDDLCLMHLLKGMCLKHLARFDESERAFLRVIEHEEQIYCDTFLIPHAAMELALLHLHLKHYDLAKTWIKRARHNYTGYLMETIVHFRLHAASRVIRNEERRSSDASGVNELEQSYEEEEDDDGPELPSGAAAAAAASH